MNLKVLPPDFSLDTRRCFRDMLLQDILLYHQELPVVFHREGCYKTPETCWSELYDPIDDRWLAYDYSADMFMARLRWADVFQRYSKRDIELLEKCQKNHLLDKRMKAIVTTWKEADEIRWTSMRSKYQAHKFIERMQRKIK